MIWIVFIFLLLTASLYVVLNLWNNSSRAKMGRYDDFNKSYWKPLPKKEDEL